VPREQVSRSAVSWKRDSQLYAGAAAAQLQPADTAAPNIDAVVHSRHNRPPSTNGRLAAPNFRREAKF